ncbi:MAG TPA: glutaredoxin family protein [Desulforhopalus sp.]|nr:glutaredoxin family protein [Desulforhopalus sp.]
MAEVLSIRLYTLSTCVHCKALREFLQARGLPFEFVDVDTLQGKERREMLNEVRQFNRRCSFPTAVVGEEVLIGFKEEEFRKVLGLGGDDQECGNGS